eukprot:8878676-Karenia_brevis.AAC.1
MASEIQPGNPPEHISEEVPNGASANMREALAAASLVHTLADRIGPNWQEEEIPAVIRRERWSSLNVPLLWGAAGTLPTTAALDWLASAAELAPASALSDLPANTALRTGWMAMRESMRGLNIWSKEDLVNWFEQQGFRRYRIGDHFAARAQ